MKENIYFSEKHKGESLKGIKKEPEGLFECVSQSSIFQNGGTGLSCSLAFTAIPQFVFSDFITSNKTAPASARCK